MARPRGTVLAVSKPLPLLQHIELEALRRLRERGRTFPWKLEGGTRGCVPAAIGHYGSNVLVSERIAAT